MMISLKNMTINYLKRKLDEFKKKLEPNIECDLMLEQFVEFMKNEEKSKKKKAQ